MAAADLGPFARQLFAGSRHGKTRREKKGVVCSHVVSCSSGCKRRVAGGIRVGGRQWSVGGKFTKCQTSNCGTLRFRPDRVQPLHDPHSPSQSGPPRDVSPSWELRRTSVEHKQNIRACLQGARVTYTREWRLHLWRRHDNSAGRVEGCVCALDSLGLGTGWSLAKGGVHAIVGVDCNNDGVRTRFFAVLNQTRNNDANGSAVRVEHPSFGAGGNHGSGEVVLRWCVKLVLHRGGCASLCMHVPCP